MDPNQVQKIVTDPPTYLKEFVPEDKIVLFYKKLIECPYNIIDQSEDETTIVENASTNTLELTGSPLKVDLEGDITLPSFRKMKTCNSWTDEEAQHYPLTIDSARKHIGNYLNNGDNLPVYVICDGYQNSIVTLGAQKKAGTTITSLVKTLGYLSKDHEDLSLGSMEKCHWLRSDVQNCTINYSVRSRHYLHGFHLRKAQDALETDICGSICVETTCQNKCTIDSPQSDSSKKRLILQVVAGHPQSRVHFLWQDLCVLQSFLHILSSDELCAQAETVVSSTPISQEEIHTSLKELMLHHKLWRASKQHDRTEFDLNNIRDENICDKFWHILKYSATLSTLRENFCILFQYLAGPSSISLITRNCNTNISVLFNRIEGKGHVPPISFKEALQFLFELGIEKMKDDYQHIIKFFYGLSRESVNNQWCKLSNLGQEFAKLAYLGRLHIASELIYLFKETKPSDPSFDYFCSKVCKTYVERDAVKHKFTELQACPLCEFSYVSNTIDTDNISGLPASWSLSMISKKQDVEITTMYHLSQHPIFPPSIYTYNEMLEIDNRDAYHVTKFEMQKYSM